MAKATKRRRTPNGEAWYRKFDDCWYATLDGAKHKLRAENNQPIRGIEHKAAAKKAALRLNLDGSPAIQTQAPTVAEVLDFFIGEIKKTGSPGYVLQAWGWLRDLANFEPPIGPNTKATGPPIGTMDATKIRKGTIEEWIAKHPGWKSPNTRRNVITVVKAAFNRAVTDEDFPLDSNPLASIIKPKAVGRVTFLEDKDVEELLGYWNRPAEYKTVSLSPIADFFTFLLHSGARPSDVAKLTAAHAEETPEGLQFVLQSHEHKTGRKTGKEKIVYAIFPQANRIARRLMIQYPEGRLFRKPRGATWSRWDWVAHVAKARKALGWDKHERRKHLSLYSTKHTFAKRCLIGHYDGIRFKLHDVAQMLGITDKVCIDHYAKRCNVTDAGLRQMMASVRNAG